jgi:enoyl-CoA hydratase
MSGRVRWERRDAVASLLLDRPEKHNAMTPAMACELAEACRAINEDDSVRCVVLHGAGARAFCTGSDINALDEYAGAFEFRNRLEYATEVRSIRKPVIAALKGWTLGGGLEMALSADVRIAAPSTRLGAPEVGLGWVGAGGASQLLPRLIGYGRALHLLLGGEPIDAERAAQWGIVEVMSEENKEESVAFDLARRWARHTTVALQTVKAAVRQSMSTPLEAGLRYENDLMTLAFALGNDAAGRQRFAGRSAKPSSETNP